MIFKYFGLIMIAVSAILISGEYEKNQRKRLREISEFIRLLEHIKTKISCFLSPKSDWLSDFSSDDTEIDKFLGFAKQASLKDSFSAVCNKLSLGYEKEILERLFSSFGKSYRDGEIELVDTALSELNNEKTKLCEECEKNVKSVKVIASAVSLGLIILFI